MEERKNLLKDLSTNQLLSLYQNHCETFYLPYCDKPLQQSEYNFRKAVLSILSDRLDKEISVKE